MLAFTSFDDLSKLSTENPARPVIQNLLKLLIPEAKNFGQADDPKHDGHIVLIDQEDVEVELEIFHPPSKLEDVFWEGTHMDRNFFVSVYVPNNQFTLICVIENSDLLPKNLRRALCACLVPSIT
jgi:hypothetical protein